MWPYSIINGQTDLAAALPLFDFTVFVLGACIGSFLNVVIWRLPRGESLIHPASHCPRCNHRLRPWENIPILAWLFLQARCSSCRSRISGRYPLIETFTAIVFFLIWRRAWQDAWPLATLPTAFLLASLVIAAAIIDIEHRIIPNRLTGPALATALLLPLLWPTTALTSLIDQEGGGFGLAGIGDSWVAWLTSSPLAYERALALKNSLLGAAAAAGLMLAIRQIGSLLWGRQDTPGGENQTMAADNAPREVLGLGDIKLLAAIGAFLGLEAVLAVIFLSAFMGTLGGLATLIATRRQNGWTVPYGPYIGAACLFWIIGGNAAATFFQQVIPILSFF